MKRMTIEEVQKAINYCALNPNVSMDDIRDVFDAILEMYHFDTAFVMTNKEYKYQLKYILNCKSPNNKIIDHDNVVMTIAQYNMLLDYYTTHQFYERELVEETHGCTGSILQRAIMRDDEYYGVVCFGRSDGQSWSHEEKELLVEISQLMLIFIGLNRLKDRRNRLENEEYKLLKSNTLEFFRVDLESGKCHALRLAPDMKQWCDVWGDYEELFNAHINTYVNKAYAKRLKKKLDLKLLKDTITIQNPNVTVKYPIEFNDRVRWIRATAELVECSDDNEPRALLLYFDDITENEQRGFYLQYAEDVTHEKYAIIAGVDLDIEQYVIYANNVSHKMPLEAVGSYKSLLDLIETRVIDKLYAERFTALFELDRLKAHFEMNEDVVQFDFSHNHNGAVKWIRLEATLAAEKSLHDGMIVLCFTDITAQKEKEKELQEISLSLEKERERVLQAELLAMMDPLTGAYNRAGFKHSTAQYRNESTPIGFVLIDVDNFKVINDTYGHSFGDEVLSLIAERLKASFRNEDKVFRLGGDEFALLLYGCHSDAWPSLQLKFASIHQYLREAIKKDITITLSAGFSQNDNGYIDELYTLADEALYHTKSVGRAGLSQITEGHKIVLEWHDSALVDRRNNSHKKVSLGNWRLELPADDSQSKGKLFLDETAHLILSIPNVLTPEECFSVWSERLVERHRELCAEMVAKVCAIGQAEATYHWNHPTKGEIAIRAAGRGHSDGSVIEIYGYMRELRESEIVLSYDDDQFLMKTLNRIFYCTYYFNLNDKEYYIVKGHEDEPDVKQRHYNIDVTLRKFVEECVHPDYQKQVADFTNLDTLAERLKDKIKIDCEYLTVTSLGWCQSRIMPVKWDEEGNVTHAMVMTGSIDAEKKEELEKEAATRKAMELQLKTCELMSSRSVLQTGVIDAVSGGVEIWTDAIFSSESLKCSFAEMKKWGSRFVYSKDLDFYNSVFTISNIVAQLREQESCEIAHRRVDENGEIKTISFHFQNLDEGGNSILMVIEDVTDNIPKGIEWMNQFDILEEFQENLAIFDYDTYDVVYMNRMARDLIGMDMNEVRGRKCYDIFGDEGKPCSFCDRIILESGKSGFMCREVRGTGQEFLLQGCCMNINGKKYRVEQAVSVADIQSGMKLSVDEKIDESQGHKKTMESFMSALKFNNQPK